MTNDQLYFEMWSELGDPQRTKYSVFDVTRGLNFVLRTISNELPRSASELKSYETLVVSSGQATLPTDFLAMKSVWNGSNKLSQVIADEDVDSYTYDIYGDTLITSDSITSLKIYYKAQLTQLDASDGSVPSGDFPLANYYVDLVKKYAILYLTQSQGDGNIAAMIGEDVRYIASGRDKTKMTIRQSFKV